MLDRNSKKICNCPMNGKKCVDGVRSDFEDKEQKCRWWEHLYGKDPQSEKIVDQWDCSVAWLPILLTEGSQMVRQGNAGVDKLSNQVSEFKGAFKSMGVGLQNIASGLIQVAENQKKLLENKNNSVHITKWGEGSRNGEADKCPEF